MFNFNGSDWAGTDVNRQYNWVLNDLWKKGFGLCSYSDVANAYTGVVFTVTVKDMRIETQPESTFEYYFNISGKYIKSKCIT